jgi:hypothetical protein
MTHSERALYAVLGGAPLVERMWNGPLPARALMFALTLVAIPLHIIAIWVELTVCTVVRRVEALWI